MVGLFALALASMVRAIGASRALVAATATLGVLAMLPWWVWMRPDAGHLLSYVANLAFLGLVGAVIAANVLRARRVDTDLVLGASSVYLLIGVFWAQIFLLVETLRPGSFRIPASADMDPTVNVQTQLAYFSYVTLATLGYGDVLPVSAPARVFAILEALLGQLYLAILIARLVGLSALPGAAEGDET